MTPKAKHDANKFTYLVKAFPKHNLQQLLAIMELPSIDMNAAIWTAEDLGFVAKPDEQTGMVELLKSPHKWEFGPELTDLQASILYCFGKLAEKETDLEENYLANWTRGYTAHDVLIAVKQLEDDEKLASYVIEDGDNSYTFFTLFENRDKNWGNKQFKTPPIAEGELVDEAEAETEEASE